MTIVISICNIMSIIVVIITGSNTTPLFGEYWVRDNMVAISNAYMRHSAPMS